MIIFGLQAVSMVRLEMDGKFSTIGVLTESYIHDNELKINHLYWEIKKVR